MEFYIDKLRTIRKQKRFTIDELAEKMGIHRTTYCGWEYGKRIPSEPKIRMLAKVLGISVDKISDLEPDIPISNVQFSEAMQSLIKVTENRELQNNNIRILRNGLDKIDRELQDTRLIINALLLTTGSLFYIKDTNLNYVAANAAFLKNLSLNKNYSVMSKKDIDFFSAIEAKKNEEQDREVLISGKSITSIEDYIPGSRKKKWGLISKIPVFDSSGKIEGVVGSFIDITDRKKAEHMRELLELNINFMGDAIFVTRNDISNFFYLNKAVEHIYGYSLDKFYDKNGKEFLIEKCINEEYRVNERKLNCNNKFPDIRIVKITDSKRKERWIEIKTNVANISDNIFILSIHRDITDDIRQKESIEKFNQAILESEDVIWIGKQVDQDDIDSFEYYYISENVSKLLGCTSKILKKKPYCWLDKVHGNDYERVYNWLYLEGYPKDSEFRIVTDEGVKWIYLRICIKDDFYYGTLYNISTRKEQEFRKEILENAMLNINDVLWIVDLNQKCVLFTGAYEELYGRSFTGVADPLKFWFDKVLHPEDRSARNEIAREFAEKGIYIVDRCKESNVENIKYRKSWKYRIIKENGNIAYIESSYTHMILNGKVYIVTIDRDITELVKLKEKLNRLENKDG